MRLHRPFLRLQAGFTLIETMLYTLIMTMVLSSFLLILQATLKTQNKFDTFTLLHEEVRFTLQKIESRTHAATTITLPTVGTTSTKLTLAMQEPSQHPTILELSNGRLLFTEGTASSTSLTSEQVEIETFTVTQIGTTPPSLRLTLTARVLSESEAIGPSITLQETISLRR